ncbi:MULTISPECIES: gas vesicle protein GvpC [Brevibacillus]|nr:gas vesicle protein GvpC [Brevibacillus parabrevis]NRQ56935.1 gas vesicle protein GvpC [Brevibacillus sp. HD1.4A]
MTIPWQKVHKERTAVSHKSQQQLHAFREFA